MGNRANIYIQTDFDAETNEWDGIGVYSHWHGLSLHEAALRALPKAMARVGDESYFARILVHNVLLEVADAESETGTGLWTRWPCDNEHPIMVINATTGHHWLADNYRDPERE